MALLKSNSCCLSAKVLQLNSRICHTKIPIVLEFTFSLLSASQSKYLQLECKTKRSGLRNTGPNSLKMSSAMKKLSSPLGTVSHKVYIKCLQPLFLSNSGSIPNLILTGPPGVGKTSSVLCIARQLLGDKFKDAVKQLNASDERGIDAVRDEIKSFAIKKVGFQKGQERTKIIILDEADSLTEGAQHALRMVISNNSDTTRFVLSCNDSSKLIDPIQSRCVIMRFNRLKENEIQASLLKVIQLEKVNISEEGLKALLFISEGDMRQALNNLQACHQNTVGHGAMITEEIVEHICDAPNTKTIKQMLLHTAKGNIHQALALLHEVFRQGYSTYDVTSHIYKVLLALEKEQEVSKQKLYQMVRLMADLKRRVLESLTTQLQVAGFIARCAMLP